MNASTAQAGRATRAEIESSWRRASMSGLRPEAALDRLSIGEFDPRSRLLVATTPVLDELTDRLAGTTFCIALADSTGRIVDRRFTDPRTERALDRISAVPGAQFTEENAGTNALGTPLEIMRGVTVHGREHFVEALKVFSCYGHPIRNPVTRRIEGVLDITGVGPEANPLFAPLMQRAVEDIEQRLWEGARQAERRLLQAFQHAAQRRCRALVGFGDELVLTNRAALDLLDPSDHAVLRDIASAAPGSGELARELVLGSGAPVTLRAHKVGGTPDGVLVELTPRARTRVPRRRAGPRSSTLDSRLAELRTSGEPVLIAGEPGTGRTRAAHLVAGARADVLDAADLVVLGEREWAEQLDSATAEALVVERIELLPEALCARLARRLAERPRVVLTSAPQSDLPAAVRSAAALCPARVDLPPLRNRDDEFARIAHAMLAEVRPGARIAPSALEALIAQPWPGNLRELRGVLRATAESRTAGDITIHDLPAAYRNTGRSARLSGRERAERDAITEALRVTGGNKVHAAQRLGISRTTLYSRMRAFGLPR
ncbi:Transcriptional regulator of acetoin/glycerol metabolism [Saccharopolyspora antimicrobica]|uniref:Transcriptional regulator of acetoin/glycerol metabolism n=1 Tax=Saccharopolyspora antimicrobica TaxID=455193 RepID=A0A1I5CNM3_9PSEU|nr:helix-turn-helix domain-containing protein [Saccharopolyspora antimicrobica]RKT88799.1 transcriptional regulator of acetoin/glycerol metabolism [Saccharopolyspora antimicrobica]SFN88625.1 Transcriptional regulator of acetoin/glycerol metabolism [Saccharopolyspora antimicrobica]